MNPRRFILVVSAFWALVTLGGVILAGCSGEVSGGSRAGTNGGDGGTGAQSGGDTGATGGNGAVGGTGGSAGTGATGGGGAGAVGGAGGSAGTGATGGGGGAVGGAGGSAGTGAGGGIGGTAGGGGTCTVGDGDGYTHNTVNLLVYRFEFPDAGLTWSEEQIRKDLDAVNQYYQQQSYGRFTVTYSIHPEVFKNSSPKTEFDADWSRFRDWYETTISSTGVDPHAPGPTNRIIVTSPQIGNFNSSGGPPLMTIFHYSPGTVAHELGHVLGLRHSKAVEAGSEIVGAGDFATESLDYGNVYCMMGMGAYTLDEYNLLYKSYFGWLECDEVKIVTTSGRYRIYAFDQGVAASDTIGLVISSGNPDYKYWVEYRLRGTFPSKQGVLFNLQGYFQNEMEPQYWKTTSYLLDMTPGSKTTVNWWADDQTDSELTLGKTYTDHWGAFKITTVQTSEKTEDATAWIEVDVEML